MVSFLKGFLCTLFVCIAPQLVNGTRFISKEAENAFYSKNILTSFSLAQANISAYLSTAAYCGKDRYFDMVLKGPATGFEYVHTIYHDKTDTQGYVGVLHSDQSIYVVFRGSSSIPNWIVNMDAVKTPYTSFGEECKGCK